MAEEIQSELAEDRQQREVLPKETRMAGFPVPGKFFSYSTSIYVINVKIVFRLVFLSIPKHADQTIQNIYSGLDYRIFGSVMLQKEG